MVSKCVDQVFHDEDSQKLGRALRILGLAPRDRCGAKRWGERATVNLSDARQFGPIYHIFIHLAQRDAGAGRSTQIFSKQVILAKVNQAVHM